MSTGGSVDERIRVALDLGDSSGAVKALDQEVEKLLSDFKKQTEAFEQGKVAPRDFAESVSKLKSEVSGLHGAMKDLGAGGGSGLDAISGKLFALERGVTSLVGGTGLGRAGGLLESGLSLLGGPAGIGALVASIAYTLDQVAPKIQASWNNMWKQFSDEQVQAKMAQLKAAGQAMKGEVDAFFTRPVPGTEGMEAERQKKLLTMFNIGTGSGEKNLRVGLLRALKESQGAAPTALSGEEKQELQGIWEKLFPAESGQRAMTEQGTLGGIIKGLEQISEVPAQIWKGKERYVAELQLQMQQLLERAAARSVSDLLLKLQQGGQPGVQAAEQLKDLIGKFPQLFNADIKTQIDDLLKLGKQIQIESGAIPGVGNAAAAYRVPTPTDIQREQEIEALEGGRIGGRGALERQQRAMFERNAMQRLMAENPQLKMSDPQHRALLEHQAADEWRMMTGGPPTRRGAEQLERDLARRGRAAELIGEHPEMTFQEVEAQARRETERRERAIYPERFRRGRRRRRTTAGHPAARPGAAAKPRSHQIHVPPRPTEFPLPDRPRGEFMQEQLGRIRERKAFQTREHTRLENPDDPVIQELRAKVQAMTNEQNSTRAEIAALREKQHKALQLEEKGLTTHAKTQQVVSGLQFQIERLYGLHKAVDNNANNLLRQQQRTQQNTTGSP